MINRMIGYLAFRFVQLTSKRCTCRGIDVLMGFVSSQSGEVLAKLDEALLLIQTHDSIRFDRITRDLSSVLVLRGGGPEYVPPIGACLLGEVLLLRSNAVSIAMMIVHEATHARLWNHGIRYDPAIRRRVERICMRAEIAFARRLPNGSAVVAWAQANLENESSELDDVRFARRRQDLEDLGLPAFLRGKFAARGAEENARLTAHRREDVKDRLERGARCLWEETTVNTNEIIQELRQAGARVESEYQEHIADNNELLPHVFFGGVTRLIEALHADALRGDDESEVLLTRLLNALERGMSAGDAAVVTLIATSFIENIDRESRHFGALRSMLGPTLSRELEQQRGHYGAD